MSTLEKNIYTRVNLPSNEQPQSPPESRAYRGLSTVNPDAKSFRLFDIELIKQDIINHFHIRQGEKLSNPAFGTIIWDVLHEPLTDSLRSLIIENVSAVVNYDPRVNVENIIIDSYDNGIQIECVLKYLIYNISETLRLKFDRDAGII
jgi:phage baseplate assembly protein W